MKIYTDNVDRIIAVRTAPADYMHEYEVPDDFLGEYSDYIKTCFAFARETGDDGSVTESTYLAVPSYVMELMQVMEGEMLKPVFAQARFSAAANTDVQALQVPELYPLWDEVAEGTVLYDGTDNRHSVDRVRRRDRLYKVIKTHEKQSTWPPETAASLFTVIDVTHAGTADDPIPASVNMVYYKDKYYVEDGVLYRCTRDSEIPLQYLPSQLLGQYFELV